MACAPCPSTRLSAASPTAPPSPPIYAASGPSSTSHERGEVGCRWGLDAACGICTLRVFALCSRAKKSAQRGCRAPGFASPLPRLRSLLCALHTSTRVQSTLVTHAPCVRASPALHMLSRGNTRLHTSKSWLPCSSHWPLADRRPARHWRIQNTNAVQSHLPSSTDASRFHQYTRCTCHPPPTSAVSCAENQS